MDQPQVLEARPNVPLRFSQPEIRWILIGLHPVVCAYAGAKKFGTLKYSGFFRVRPDLRPMHGEFHQPLMDRLLRLYWVLRNWSENPAKTHRAHLDAIDLEMMALGTRLAGTQVLHGHATSPCARPKQTAKRLLRKIERLRRRAARLWKGSTSGNLYKAMQARWHNFVNWVRGDAVYCRCNRPPIMSAHRRRKAALNSCERVAKQLIQEMGLEMPTPGELRRLVRLFTRYARRGRLAVGFRDIANGNERLRYSLGRFLSDRLSKQQPAVTNEQGV